MSSLSVSACREISAAELTIDLEHGQIGRGGFATVFAALWFSNDVAVKLIALVDEGETKLKKEIGLLSLLNHPGIIRVYGVTYLDNKMGIVMDRASSFLHTPSVLSTTTLSHAISITSALLFLHSNNFVHRDLKPQNILMVDGRPRISDFGTSKIVAETATLNTINVMTPKYAALEAFDNNSCQESDVYSLGVILYELLTNKVAFEGINSQIALFGVKCRGTQLPFDDTTPLSLQNIINKCLDNDPSKRPCICQILDVLNQLTAEVGIDESFAIEINNNDEFIQQLRRNDLKLRSEINQLNESNHKKDELIAGHDQRIQKLNDAVDTKDSQLEQLSVEILQLRAQNAKLKHQIEELERQNELNTKLIHSNSSFIRICVWAWSQIQNNIFETIEQGFSQNWPNIDLQIAATNELHLNNIDNFDVFVYNSLGLEVEAALLEQIVAAGKGLVLFSCEGYNIKGDFKYGAFKGLTGSKYLGSFMEISHSDQKVLIMKSVNSFSCDRGAKYTSINPDFQAVACLENGEPLLLKSDYYKGRVVDFASDGFSCVSVCGWKSSTDGHLLLANSIVWVYGRDY
ncbi:hypothetical protein P9112_010548 [Eukaryota sp. TZLM1-RC]